MEQQVVETGTVEAMKKEKGRLQAQRMRDAQKRKRAERALKAVEITPAPAIKVNNDSDKVTFFTEIDLDAKGNPKASYPFYFNKKRMDEVREEYKRLKGMIDRREVPPEYTGEVMEKIRAHETEMAAIEKHKPNVKNIDKIRKYRDELEEAIKPTMFTSSEMKDGLVDPNEEARRMTEPIISVPQDIRELIANNGGKLSKDGKASRDDLTRTWQMCQWHLREHGEYVNLDAESLRKR